MDIVFNEAINVFQHTAARRRLANKSGCVFLQRQVSTHSRPKAAGMVGLLVLKHTFKFQHTAARRRLGTVRFRAFRQGGFNTQPPEGGWELGRTYAKIP